VISMLPALLAGWHAQAQEITDNLEVSGFARVIGGYLDHDDRRFEGYTDEVSFGEQSLVAVQPTYSFNDKLSVTSQLIGHTNSDRDSGVEWAYLSYQPNSAWHLRAGKLRTPFFIYSDSIDVGYSYPWVTAPIQIYDNYMFSTFNGASASYYQSGSEVALNLEAYYGYFKGDLFFEGSKVDLETEVEDLAGIVENPVPATGSNGKIKQYALELSNVDLTNEFAFMISHQRSFQAGSRIITTSDAILTEAVNLKR